MAIFNSLKGVLALMIFIHHLGLYDGGGSLAVALFFALGGFLSTLGYKDRILSPDFSYKNYMLGKCIKFYPMHWLLLFAAVPLMFYGGSNSVWTSGIIFGINAFLLQSWVPVESVYFSGNSVSWYLSDTLAFVAVFPLVLKWMLKGSKTAIISVATGVAVIYILLWIFLPEGYTHRFFYIHPMFRIIDYAAGMFAALCYLKIKDSEFVKAVLIGKQLKLLYLLSGICLFSLLAISLADKQLVLHAAIYMPYTCILLIIMAFVEDNGGGKCRFSKSSARSVLPSSLCIKYA